MDNPALVQQYKIKSLKQTKHTRSDSYWEDAKTFDR